MHLNALSIDLEEYFQVSNFSAVIDRDSWSGLPSRVCDATHRLLDTLDRTETRATFFVLGWVAERQPDLIRALAERGHEIACHGYGHELVYEIGPVRFREDLIRARASACRGRSFRCTSRPHRPRGPRSGRRPGDSHG